jgi:hypothetical protein
LVGHVKHEIASHDSQANHANFIVSCVHFMAW